MSIVATKEPALPAKRDDAVAGRVNPALMEAIRSFFPGAPSSCFLSVREVGEDRYRVNWFRDYDLLFSRYISVSKTPDGFVVEDRTK